MSKELGYEKEFALYAAVEELAPKAFKEVKGVDKKMCANIDFYSGFVYQMLGIPEELYTPIFAMARIVGWCAHRIEEITTGGRIIRPAYKSAIKRLEYTPIDQRKTPTIADIEKDSVNSEHITISDTKMDNEI